jgi:DNA invertase Pin-like site-specific DNA recombinase
MHGPEGALSSPMKVVTYLRVSTQRQGLDGLGIEAQRRAVEVFLNGNGWEHVAEYVEVESGRTKERHELQRALKACRVHRATLVVSRLDRLSRNASFLLSLRDAGVDVRFADMPSADRLVVGILAMVAEWEAAQISARTKAALAAAKARGTILGRPENLRNAEAGQKASAELRTARANRWAEDLRDTVEELRAQGANTLQALADALTAQGLATPRGSTVWSSAQAQRLLQRLDKRGVS